MTLATLYIYPNITVESFLIGVRKFYIYNYKGVHYRVFCSLGNLRKFLSQEIDVHDFECESENELEKYLLA
jgi:YHS domain-containing protein